MTNLEFLDNQLRVSDKMRVRRLEIVGHCIRHSELSANPLILWEPTQGKATRGMKFSYIDMLKWDTGYASPEELRTGKLDRKVWREIVHQTQYVAQTTLMIW
jgi:hypothetical protein